MAAEVLSTGTHARRFIPQGMPVVTSAAGLRFSSTSHEIELQDDFSRAKLAASTASPPTPLFVVSCPVLLTIALRAPFGDFPATVAASWMAEC